MVEIKPEDISSIDSEAGVIASLIHSPELYFYAEYLEPNHFVNLENRCMYTSIKSLVEAGIRTIDSYNVVEYLTSSEATRNMANVLSVDKVSEFVEMSYVLARNSAEEYKMLADKIMDTSFRRDIMEILDKYRKLCETECGESIKRDIYKEMEEVSVSYSRNNEIPEYKDVVDGYWDEIKGRQGAGYSGIPFKFPTLNEYVTMEKGELVIFGAQQKVGKSIMLLNCAVDLLRQGYSVLYIDSELSSRLFTARLLSHLSKIEYRNLTSGNYSEEDEEKIIAAKEWMKDKKFCHIYMPFFDEKNIYTAVKQRNCVEKIDVIIIDYFKSTGKEVDAFQTYAAMGRCVDLIKNEIAGDMGIAALGAAQATINNKLADSAKIARNASTIIMLVDKTPEEITRDGAECGNKKAIVTINRNGMQHADGEYISLYFDGNRISYEEAKQAIPQVPY